MESKPELMSIEAFAEFLMEDERTSFNLEELCDLSYSVRKCRNVVRKELESYGFEFELRKHGQYFRGVSSNDNDRWYGRGAEKMHGGSGWEQINGFAGQKG